MKRLINWLFSAMAPNSSIKKDKKKNFWLFLLLPFATARTKSVYNHSVVKSYRLSSDCVYRCPDVDIWQYQYKDPHTAKIIIGKKSLAIKKQYWKSEDEARIIAISMFDGNDFYYKSLLQYIESFKNIKKLNNIKDDKWGYETFTLRAYVSKRNPADLVLLGEIKNRTPDYIIEHLLDLGCEIAYVDNKLQEAKKDGTFWRFAAAADQMPDGEKVRYLIRDADSVLTAAELYSVADWIRSDKKFHRMHLTPICMGPLTAMLWGGSHIGRGEFSDFHDLVKNYPYRFDYGDDELFLRDLIWPRIKSLGSVLTHHFPRGGFINWIGTPYKNSSEEPTQEFCLKLNPYSKCEDRILPKTKNLFGVTEALALRRSLEKLVKTRREIFDLDLGNPDNIFVYQVLKAKPETTAEAILSSSKPKKLQFDPSLSPRA